jgi:hypothetical protein
MLLAALAYLSVFILGFIVGAVFMVYVSRNLISKFERSNTQTIPGASAPPIADYPLPQGPKKGPNP